MKNDFITIYKKIERSEQDGFEKYIQFFYGQQKTVLAVFNQVVEAIENHKEEVFYSIVSNNKKAQNDLSDLKKWLLEFLTIQEVRGNSPDVQFVTLEALRKRKLMPTFSQKAKQLDKILRGHPSPDIWTMLRKLRLAHIQYFDLEIDPLQNYQNQLTQLLNELDDFYISTKLKYTAEAESRAYILHEKHKPRFLYDQLLHVTTTSTLDLNINNLYLPLLNLAKDQSETAYKELKTFLIQNKKHEPIERLSVLLYLLNFAITRMRKGDEIYKNEYFELTEIGLSQSLFIATGYMSTEVFTNAVNLACLFQRHDWAEKFIADWSPYLEHSVRKVNVYLALARIHFDRKEYEEATDLLIEITSYKNMAINVNARLLLARTYYEQEKSATLRLSYCNSLYQYAHKNKDKNLGADMRQSILNFTKLLRSLILAKPKTQLVKELDSLTHPIICLEWLKAKIDEQED